MPPESAAWTMLPGSTWRRPVRPEMGEVMREYVRFSRAPAIAPSSDFTAASAWATVDVCASTCCCGIRPWVTSSLKRARVDLREELALLHELAFPERHAQQLAVDAGAHRDGRERSHRSEARE